MTECRRVSGEGLFVSWGWFGSSRICETAARSRELWQRQDLGKNERITSTQTSHEYVKFGLANMMGETLIPSDTKTKERHVCCHAPKSVRVCARCGFVDADS
jgi:hypothetical protein